MKDVKQSTRLRPLTNQELIDSYDYLSGAASSQDCTGLIPSAGFRYKRQQRSP